MKRFGTVTITTILYGACAVILYVTAWFAVQLYNDLNSKTAEAQTLGESNQAEIAALQDSIAGMQATNNDTNQKVQQLYNSYFRIK